MRKARPRSSRLGSAVASSCRPAVRNCWRVRSATRTTGSTTSRRWAPKAEHGWSARRTVPSRFGAIATSCSSLPRSALAAAGLIAAFALVAGWNAYKYPSVVGEHVHPGDPHKLGQVLNWFVLLATAGVLWLLARELFPRRPWLQLSALAFFCFLPVVLRV